MMTGDIPRLCSSTMFETALPCDVCTAASVERSACGLTELLKSLAPNRVHCQVQL